MENKNVSKVKEVKNVETIFGLLQKSRYELSKIKLEKSGYNGFGKFKYFELADFLPTCIEILNKNGLSTMFSIDFDNNGVEYAVMKVVKSETGETIDFRVPTAETNSSNNPIQALGSKVTYLRRYLWLMVMDIVENDESDAVDNKKEKAEYATKNQKEMIMKYAKLIANELNELNIKKPNDLSKMTLEEASELCNLIKDRYKNIKKEEGVENGNKWNYHSRK